MRLRIGFSPCPNDTFILHALLHGLIDTGELSFEPYIADVEALNQLAMSNSLEITKMSFHAFLKVMDHYRLLESGAALGFGCGPIIIAKRNLGADELRNGVIALPGELTTAHMLFVLHYPDVKQKQFMVFSEIENAVLEGEVDAGVIIHENRFTFQDKGLVAIEDLGQWWESTTGLPIPLGAFAVKKDLPPTTAERVESMIARSVEYAFQNPSASAGFVKEHAQEMERSVIQRHIDTYVNRFSVALGTQGAMAVEELKRKARFAGLV